MIAIMTNNAGINILETLPIPSSTSLCETYHNAIHKNTTQIVVYMSKTPAFAKSEPPPTVFVKKPVVSEPQLNVKLDRKYTISQLRITR